MLGSKLLFSCAITIALAIGPGVQAQSGTQAGPHLIVVKLVELPGNKMPFGFEPASFTAQRGDTIEFVQFANTMHNVHFKTEPKGARLGSAAISPYLVAKGQTYEIVVDSRFAVGTYELVCDPHEMLGMHGMLTVVPTSPLATAR